MNTPAGGPRARPNDDQELERFKDQIPLVALATGRYGYELKEKARNDSWHKLEKGGEVLIVSQKEGRDIYMNTNDTKDSGSVVDFVKTRDGLNLGQVRQQLRQYLGEGGPERDRAQLAARPLPSSSRKAERGADAGLPDDPQERRDVLLRRTLGVQPTLTDRSYLRDRGLNDETINAPAFQGRIFTGQNGPHKNTVFPLLNENGYSSYEERNHNFKNQMPGPRDGIWVSHPTHGKGTAVERIVVGESPIDALSKYQLDQPGGTGPNTMYMTSSGTVSQRQVELMQKVIDRQQPKELVLANDNDPAGVRFNLNYLNDFRAPRPAVSLENGVESAEQQRGAISWRATRAGDYHTDLKVTFDTERQREGRQAVTGLQQKVDGWQQEGGQEAARLEVVRLGSDQTVARVTVTNDQLPQLRTLVQELHTQREAGLPEAQRTPAAFFTVEAARSKDFNQDLTDQLTEQRLQRAREQAGFTRPEVAAVGVSPIERSVKLEIVEQNTQQPGGGAAGQIEQDLVKVGLRVSRVQQQVDEQAGTRTTQLQGQYLITDPESRRAAISTQLEIIGRAPGVTLTEPEADRQERRQLGSNGPKLPLEQLPERQLAESRREFSALTKELGSGLDQQGQQLQGARMSDLSRNIVDREILPLRGLDRESLTQAIDTATKLPAFQQQGQPGPLLQKIQQADKRLHQRYDEVQQLGGPGGQRALVIVLDDKASQENRATQLWKDLKAEGAGVGNMTERTAATGIIERQFPIKYDPTPGPVVAGVTAVLTAAERSPGISIEEPALGRQVRQLSAATHNQQLQEQQRPVNSVRTPYASQSAEWVSYAVTSPAAAGSPELKEQISQLKQAGATVAPLAGQGQAEPTQLVSFNLQDPRLGAISEAGRAMSAGGGNRYDVERRIAVGENGGWAAGLIRLTEAQDAALRTPQIQDDLRANGVLVQEARRVEAPVGLVREEVRIAYQTEHNPLGVASVLDTLKRSPGIEVIEEARQQQAREALAQVERERLARQQAEQTARESEARRVQAEQELARQRVEQQQREANDPAAQRAREQDDRLLTGAILTAAALSVGEQQRADPKLHEEVRRENRLGAQAAEQSWETNQARSRAPLYEQATEQQRSPAMEHPYRYVEIAVADRGHNEDKIRVMKKDFEQAGASVGSIEPTKNFGYGATDQLRMMVGYRIDQPELPAITQQLREARTIDTVTYKERGGQDIERSMELERRENSPQVSQLFAAEAAREKATDKLPFAEIVAGYKLEVPGIGKAAAGTQSREIYPAEGWKTQVLRERRDDELQPAVPALAQVGAQVGGTLPDGAGGREMHVSYHPAAAQQDKVLEVIEQYQAARELRGPETAAPAAPALAATATAPERTAATEKAPERVLEAAPTPAPATVTSSVTEQPFRTVGISVVGEPGQQRTQNLQEELARQGAVVGEIQAKPAGEQLTRESFTASYALAPQSAALAQTLEAAGRLPGVSLQEPLAQQRERQQLYNGQVEPVRADVLGAPGSGYSAGPPQGPGQWQQGVILVGETDAERQRTATLRDALQKSGAQVGSGGERADGQDGGAIRYSYNTRQAELPKINEVLDKAQASPSIEVREQAPQKPEQQLEERNGKFNAALITIDDRAGTGQGRAETLSGELSRNGAVVGEIRHVNGQVEMPISYHTKTPAIQQLNETLDRAANSGGISVQENGEDRGARLQGAQDVARESAGADRGKERE